MKHEHTFSVLSVLDLLYYWAPSFIGTKIKMKGLQAIKGINESSVNPQSTSNQSSKPCTVLQYPSKKEFYWYKNSNERIASN